MKKEEYLKKSSEILSKINELEKEGSRLIKEYIEKNKEFDIGEKVKLVANDGTEKLVFVRDVLINRKGDIYYKYFKCKKDGTPSKHEHWSWFVKNEKPQKLINNPSK
jgi:hypothetical protein